VEIATICGFNINQICKIVETCAGYEFAESLIKFKEEDDLS
jgi:hypothetical protein